MLSEDVLMPDIAVGHWRNLQALVLQSASARPRIIVIHDEGKLLKLAHSADQRRDELVRLPAPYR